MNKNSELMAHSLSACNLQPSRPAMASFLLNQSCHVTGEMRLGDKNHTTIYFESQFSVLGLFLYRSKKSRQDQRKKNDHLKF